MTDRLPSGKVPWDLVAPHVRMDLPADVLLGPAAGEDAALVEIGGEVWAVASDPISFTASDAGRLAVLVNANDVAVRGAVPRFFLVTLLLAADEAEQGRVEELLGQVRRACSEVGAVLVGGHTEVAPGIGHSVVVGTMLGPVADRVVTSGGVREGHRIGVTRSVGLEGTAILLGDHGGRLREVLGDDVPTSVGEVLPEGWMSVVPEALRAAGCDGVSALHDVTEGGVGEALFELGKASGLRLEVERGNLPVLPVTEAVCGALGIDPLGLIGSGALLVGCRPDRADAVQSALDEVGAGLAWIGEAVRGEPGSSLPRFPRDELLRVVDLGDLEAVLFDMDGTLVDSAYDWPAIRRRLEIDGPSIIDQINGLPESERRRRWADLEAIERDATARASLKEGVHDLLELLAGLGVATALVTNNSRANARSLLDRYELPFEVVLTRDDGVWKPSGQPFTEALERLGAEPSRTLAVGDSQYDLQAARGAGCGWACLLYEGAVRHRAQADLALADVPALARYLRIMGPRVGSET